MGCRCNERGQALRQAAGSAARGDLRSAGASLTFVGKTLAQDARSGALRQAATQHLAQMRRKVR